MGFTGATQRALADLLTEAAVGEAAVADETENATSMKLSGTGELGRPAPGLGAVTAKGERALHVLGTRDMLDEASDKLDSTFAARSGGRARLCDTPCIRIRCRL